MSIGFIGAQNGSAYANSPPCVVSSGGLDCTLGNTLVVYVFDSDGVGTPGWTVTDSATPVNVYSQQLQYINAGVNIGITVFTAAITTSKLGNVLTATSGGSLSGGSAIIIFQFSGAGSVVDVSATGVVNGTTLTSSLFTPSPGDVAIFGAMTDAASGTVSFTAGGSYIIPTNGQVNSTPHAIDCACEYLLNLSASPQTASISCTAGPNMAGIVTTLLPIISGQGYGSSINSDQMWMGGEDAF